MSLYEQNKELIESRNIPYSDKLRMVPTTHNCTYPTGEEIFNLLTKKYLFATLAATPYDSEYFKFIYDNLNGMYKIEKNLTDDEKVIIEQLLANNPEVNRDRLSWLYEECFIYAWIIELVDFPVQDCENKSRILDDVLYLQADHINKRNLPSKLYGVTYDKETKQHDFNRLKLKSFDEILEKADLVKRYLWGLEELRMSGAENKSGLNELVVHYQVMAFSNALKWDLTAEGV